MLHKITKEDIRLSVNNAYDAYRDIDKGEVDPRVSDSDPKSFAISVVLNDGTTISHGDSSVKAALGKIAGLAVYSLLLRQYSLKELIKLMRKPHGCKVRALNLPLCAGSVRAVSAVIPQDDPDGKYAAISSALLQMLGSDPELDFKLYELLAAQVDGDDFVNKLASVGYEMYDNAEDCAMIFAKLESLKVDTVQLATLGATIANNGVNPVTGVVAFDEAVAAPLTTIVATNDRGDRLRRWLLKSGVPAVFSFSGLALAIMPGIGAIAAYAPPVGKHGRSKKGARAIRFITEAMGYNIFSSTHVRVDCSCSC